MNTREEKILVKGEVILKAKSKNLGQSALRDRLLLTNLLI
jgi:hypothetical protein